MALIKVSKRIILGVRVTFSHLFLIVLFLFVGLLGAC